MKYYKITNEEELHNSMKYKTGLNIDITPFKPLGDCESGGIYFSREDILAFIDYGVWIREVTLPEGEEVYENPGKPKKWKSHRVILGERRRVDLNTIKYLVEQGADVHADGDCSLKWASQSGHLEVVKYLVEQGADVHADGDWSLKWASQNGHLEVVKYLVEQGANNDYALRLASSNGHLEVVKYLFKQDYSLRWASYNGYLEVVKYLVEQGADVHVDDDYALKWASQSGHLEVVKYLKNKMEK